MLLFEAKAELEERLRLQDEYGHEVPEYFEALQIASACIDAQIRLADILNSFTEKEIENDMYSANLCYDILNQCRFDWTEDDLEGKE